jgi:hypothetical protein
MSLSTAARVMLPALVLLVTMALVSPSKTCLQQVEEKSHLQSPSSVAFTDVAGAAGINALQCEIRTSPNCLFPQWDKTLKRWDQGGFCMEETLTGGACIGDFDSDGIDDLYYPRMDGADILYANRGDGTFVDVTERSGLLAHVGKIRSNGCLFVDIDNDGDSDLYISTLGDKQFYLFVNDGDGKFTEEAVERGLGNIKTGNYPLTAGFTIAAGDYDLDGDLDIITTEWLPWLDREENSDMPSFDDSKPINQNFLDSVAEMYMNMTKPTKRNPNETNARLFQNLGPEKVGFFADVTHSSKVMPDLSSPFFRNRDESLHRPCRQINAMELKEVLEELNEPIKAPGGGAEIREAFDTFMETMTNGKIGGKFMNKTLDDADPSQYSYLKITGQELRSPVLLTVTARSDVDGPGQGANGLVQVYVSGRENPTPTSKRGKHSFKASTKREKGGGARITPARLELDVGGAYGRHVNIGIKCLGENGCNFQLSYIIQPKPVARRPANGKTECEPTTKFVGAFKVDLVLPKVRSEPFLQWSVHQMKRLNFSISTMRDVMRETIQYTKDLDGEKLVKMTHTQSRFADGFKRGSLTNPMGVLDTMKMIEGHMGGKPRSNHAAQFPLVGAFQFAAKFSDLDDDGYPDIVVSGDFGTSQLHWNLQNGTFLHGHFHLVEDLFDNSMGATIGDWNQDGKMDVMFTSTSISDGDLKNLNAVASTAGMILSFRGNHLYQNLGNRRFTDVTGKVGVRESGWGWGAFFFDFDNDGDLDALNGNGMDDPETTDDDWAVNQQMRMYVNLGKENGFSFSEEAQARGIASLSENRAAMTWDYDNDGDLDVFVVNHGDRPHLYRNNGGNYYDYLRVRVFEERGRPSIGAKVYLTISEDDQELVEEISSTAAFLGQGENTAHFGLGKRGIETVHKVRIKWLARKEPNGAVGKPYEEVYFNVPVRSTLRVWRGSIGKSVVEEASSMLEKCQIHEVKKGLDPNPASRSTVKESGGRAPSETKSVPSHDHRTIEQDKIYQSLPSNREKRLYKELLGRYDRASHFFLDKIKKVDGILAEAKARQISDDILLASIKKKYPFVAL